MKKGTLVLSFLIALFISVFVAQPATAFGGDIIQDDHTTVTKDQTVDNVVVFGNDAVIKGHVRGSVIVIDGDLSIEKTAKVKDVVLVIGGKILEENGAKVSDEVFNIAFGNGASLGFIVAGIMLITSWSLRLGFSLLCIVIVVLTMLIMRGKTNIFESVFKRKPLRIILIGAVASVLTLVIGILLAVTIIGISVALLLFLFWLVFLFIGLTVASQMVSRYIVGHEKRKPWLSGLYGAFVLVGFMNLPFLGLLLVLGVMFLSSAYMALWVFKKISFKNNNS
ncbi:MAG: hypothetical protein ACO1OC_01760 [Tuberibacillus sp.]